MRPLCECRNGGSESTISVFALRSHWHGTDPPGTFANNRLDVAVTAGADKCQPPHGRRSLWLNICDFAHLTIVIGYHGEHIRPRAPRDLSASRQTAVGRYRFGRSRPLLPTMSCFEQLCSSPGLIGSACRWPCRRAALHSYRLEDGQRVLHGLFGSSTGSCTLSFPDDAGRRA